MQGPKRDVVQIGDLLLSLQEYNNWRGKFGRACTPKPVSGRLDVPKDIHEVFISKGKAKGQMFEQFIKAGGDKDWVHNLLRDAQGLGSCFILALLHLDTS